MCEACYKEYGSPKIWNDKTRAAVKLIVAVYDQPNGAVGGGLHIVLDDWNLETKHIRGCIDTTKVETPAGDIDTTLTPIEMACAEHLLTMTFPERAAVLARLEGFYDPGAKERQELREAARGNLSGADLSEVLRLIEGPYKDDPDAVRGAIWSFLEGDENSS